MTIDHLPVPALPPGLLPPDLGLGAPFDDDDVDEAIDADPQLLDVDEIAARTDEGTGPAAWRIRDESDAEWAMRKVAELQAREVEIAQLAQGWRDPIDAWEAESLAPLRRRAAFFSAHLVAFLELRMADDPKLRTLKLPSGKVSATMHQAKVALVDDDDARSALIGWLDEVLDGDDLAAVVHTERKAMISELRKRATASARRIGSRHRVSLVCGHHFDLFDPEEDDESNVPAVGDEVACAACPAELGEPALRVVESLDSDDVIEPVVWLNDTGQPIPGTRVEPATTTYNVKPGRS